MTEDEIRKLEAGPITNMHIARLVFNHDAVGYTEYPDGTRLYYGGPDNSYPLLDYSTDIAAAWRVVEEIHLFDDRYLIETTNGWGIYGVSPVHPMPGFEIVLDAPTAPLAICRAALLAVSELEEK